MKFKISIIVMALISFYYVSCTSQASNPVNSENLLSNYANGSHKAIVLSDSVTKPNPVTDLAASPSVHRNLYQYVTLTWSASTDSNATGYQIYRQLSGQSGYSVIKSITYRSASLWIDSTVTWSSTNSAQYYIRVYDGTHNLLSNVSNTVVSYYVSGGALQATDIVQ